MKVNCSKCGKSMIVLEVHTKLCASCMLKVLRETKIGVDLPYPATPDAVAEYLGRLSDYTPDEATREVMLRCAEKLREWGKKK